jgi:hypothetical protein
MPGFPTQSSGPHKPGESPALQENWKKRREPEEGRCRTKARRYKIRSGEERFLAALGMTGASLEMTGEEGEKIGDAGLKPGATKKKQQIPHRRSQTARPGSG